MLCYLIHQEKFVFFVNETILKVELKCKQIQGSREFSKGVDLFTAVKA